MTATSTPGRLLLWSPRILGIMASLFTGLFALDAFSQGKPFAQALPDFVIHLIPAVALLAIVSASWRWEWIGGVAFLGLALWYTVTMATRRIDWVVMISGPLAVVGALFLLSWFRHGELRAHRTRCAGGGSEAIPG